jgi:nucleotide-binding universal stress UspA family protein
MIDFDRILHPTDFSEQANHALRYACGLCAQFGAELHLLHVVPEPALLDTGGVMDGFTSTQAWSDALTQHANERLLAMPDPVWAAGKTIVRAVSQGAVFVEVVQYARDNAIDLIVIGTHGRTGLTHMLLGSVAERVVRKAPCPVLTVRPPDHTFKMP